MDILKAKGYIDSAWADSILPQLVDYVRIPNKSPIFDPEWEQHGYMERAVSLLEPTLRERRITVLRLRRWAAHADRDCV